MNDIQENRLSMINKTCDYVDEHATELSGITSIATQNNALKATRDAIITEEGEAVEDTTGTAELKQQRRTAVTNAILQACAAVESLAVDTNDPELRRKMNYTKSELDTLRDFELVGVAELVYIATEAVIGSLGAYLYDGAALAIFLTARTNYSSIVTKPKAKIEGKATAGHNVDELFDDANVILDKLDVFLKNFRFAPDGLYFGYLLARRIDDNSGPSSGGGGGSTGTEYTGTVNPMSFATLPVTYNSTTPVLLENPGTVTLFYHLFLNGLSNSSQKQVDPGASDTFLMGEWSANGNEIRIFNNTAAPGSYKITLG